MIGIIILTVVALVLSLMLVLIDSLIKEEKNPYLELLPGYNCGQCGFISCQGMSEAMKKDVLNYKRCYYLRDEKLKQMEDYLERSGKI